MGLCGSTVQQLLLPSNGLPMRGTWHLACLEVHVFWPGDLEFSSVVMPRKKILIFEVRLCWWLTPIIIEKSKIQISLTNQLID